MVTQYAPEQNVSENDGNPEPDADELQCQDGDVHRGPRFPSRRLSADVHGAAATTTLLRFERLFVS